LDERENIEQHYAAKYSGIENILKKLKHAYKKKKHENQDLQSKLSEAMAECSRLKQQLSEKNETGRWYYFRMLTSYRKSRN
jgi:chromosome segregation ATPase